MKVVSVRDLQKIKEFEGMSEIEILNPKMDKQVAPYLHELGIDIRHDVEITAHNHRDMCNGVGIGYRIVGEVRLDREYINGPFSDIVDRVAATGYTDVSLTRELTEKMGTTANYQNFIRDELDDEIEDSIGDDGYLEDTYEETTQVMGSLMEQVVSIRGSHITKYSLE